MDRLLEATARAERDHFWFRGFRRFVTPLLERAAGGRRNLRALDCGCGTGHNLALLRRFGAAVGIDLTFSGLRYAAARGDRQVAQASAAALPFGDGTFDLVTSFDGIYSLPDEVEQAAVAEMFRVLKPGGHRWVSAAAPLDVTCGCRGRLRRRSPVGPARSISSRRATSSIRCRTKWSRRPSPRCSGC